MVDCTHGMPSPAACVDCMAEGNLPAPPKRVRSEYTAEFVSTCSACGRNIVPGDFIQPMFDDDAGDYWVHAGCEDS